MSNMPFDSGQRAALAAKAARLRELHDGPRILVLPNAWDVASARVFAQAGFPAIATTSAGMAATLGYADGERISRAEMLDMVGRIARAVAVPVTADLEGGYGDPEETARALIAVGAVGLNLEDSTAGQMHEIGAQADRIRTIRRVAQSEEVPVVINARTDIYLAQVGVPEARFDETVRRGNVYLEAGADCVFVPGLRDADAIGRMVRAVRGALNILAVAGAPTTAELERLGVARVSTGSGPSRAAWTTARRIAAELKERGTYTAFTESVLTYDELYRLMAS